ncbi:MAG: hypothetical protein OEY14_04775 [Myxococcales bacterium]|nr:hypothetical protein [Myxococcales bacterium]
MYAGKIVERASAIDLFAAPLHPYTRGLLASLPSREAVLDGQGRRRLPTIAGVVPDLRELPAGCRFRDRCIEALSRCAEAEPPLGREGARWVACFARRSEEVSPPEAQETRSGAEAP